MYHGPDLRVLFADWFLDAHCFSFDLNDKDEAAGIIRVKYEPKGKSKLVDVSGELVLDATNMALREFTFVHRNLPSHIKEGKAGGMIAFARLESGAWLPVRWEIFAPIESNFVTFQGGRSITIGGNRAPPPRARSAVRSSMAACDSPVPSSTHEAIECCSPWPLVSCCRPRRSRQWSTPAPTPHSASGSAPSARCRPRSIARRWSPTRNASRQRVRDARRSVTGVQWRELACGRALLQIIDAPSARGSHLMSPGTSWGAGAIDGALRALALAPADRPAGRTAGVADDSGRRAGGLAPVGRADAGGGGLGGACARGAARLQRLRRAER